jgi:hypothetical protein
MSFIKYMHLERFGNTEVEGIEVGLSYVFPKIDGTNASVWKEEAGGVLCCGSRNRQLSLDADNAGFMAAMVNDFNIQAFTNAYPWLTLYGEWLVPHTVKYYNDDAWRKFYVFDVYDTKNECFVPYEDYAGMLTEAGLHFIAPVAIVKNGTYEMFVKCIDNANFLIKDGAGVAEGVVIKNYAYKNKYGRQCWAKIVSNEFKDNHIKTMGAPVVGCEVVEEKIVDKYVTQALVDKVYAKIVLARDGWTSQFIPQLLHTVFYDLVREEMWNIVRENKNPTINFKTLATYTTVKVKQLKKELF